MLQHNAVNINFVNIGLDANGPDGADNIVWLHLDSLASSDVVNVLIFHIPDLLFEVCDHLLELFYFYLRQLKFSFPVDKGCTFELNVPLHVVIVLHEYVNLLLMLTDE